MKHLLLLLFCVLIFSCDSVKSGNIQLAISSNNTGTNPSHISKEERLLLLLNGKILDTTIGENEKSEDLVEVENLIKAGVDVNVRDKSTFQTPVMIAVQNNRIASLRLLLNASANTNLQDNDGQTALMTAANYGDVAMVKLLLERGADTKIENNSGYTALTGAEYPSGGEKYLEPKKKYAYLEIRRLLKNSNK